MVNKNNKFGKLIVITGPSGAGKKTIWSGILDDKKYNTKYSISMTTRKKRNIENDKVDYFFVTKKDFIKAIKNNELLEWAKYVNNYYGTPKKFVFNNLKKGNNVFLEIEVQGAIQIMNNFKSKFDLITIFIAPPSINDLKKRLLSRKTEKDKIIRERLKQSKWEMKKTNLFKYLIVNTKIEQAKKRLSKILDNELIK